MTGRYRSRGSAVGAAGSAMLAALLLFSATAFGAPANTALPTISPATPEVSKSATATTGSWNSSAAAHWIEGESTKLKEGEKANVTANGGPITIAATVGGTPLSLTCDATVTGATLENPSGGGAGIGSAEIAYENCAATGGGAPCAVSVGPAVPVSLALSTVESRAKIAISPVGANLGTFTLSGCPVANNYKLIGVIDGFYSNAASQIEFNPETTLKNKALRLQSKIGPVASATATIGLETGKGEDIQADSMTYAYQWKRCASKVCTEIAGATGSTYTPVAADLGKKLTVSVTATDTTGATTATSFESGTVVGNFRWYACGEWGEPGVYKDAGCTNKEGASKPFSWSQVTSLPFTVESLAGAPPITIDWTWGITDHQLLCTGASGEGTLSNPGLIADISEFNLTLTGCEMSKPTSCVVSSSAGKGKLAFKPLAASAVSGTKPELKFVPQEGPNLLEFTLTECAMGGSYKFTGWFPALFHNFSAEGYVESTSSEVKAAGGMKFQGSIVAGISSTFGVLGEGGLPIKLDYEP